MKYFDDNVDTRCRSLIEVDITPEFNYRFDTMKPGVLQHLDRTYTYDVVPDRLLNGYLFQGIHRPPTNIVVSFTLLVKATVYFFFHYTADGGYSDIFHKLDSWERCGKAPQYDIHNGNHGLTMVMYRLTADICTYTIPPTTKDKACFSFVFLPDEPS